MRSNVRWSSSLRNRSSAADDCDVVDDGVCDGVGELLVDRCSMSDRAPRPWFSGGGCSPGCRDGSGERGLRRFNAFKNRFCPRYNASVKELDSDPSALIVPAADHHFGSLAQVQDRTVIATVHTPGLAWALTRQVLSYWAVGSLAPPTMGLCDTLSSAKQGTRAGPPMRITCISIRAWMHTYTYRAPLLRHMFAAPEQSLLVASLHDRACVDCARRRRAC